MRLTDEQEKFVTSPIDENKIVISTAGSGKTTSTIQRVFYMIKECKVAPKSIAMFTYNRSLGDDMSKKLKKMGIDADNLFHCNTLHSFCYQFTKDYQDLGPWIDKFTDQKCQYSTRGFSTSFDPSNQLKYIIFDEYQDADVDIASVIKILSKDRYLTIVGDNRQQLYAYRGANIKHLSSLKDDFVEYTLSETFRCNKNICAFLNAIWKKEDEKESEIIIHSKIEGPRPLLYRSKGSAMNNPNITNEIIQLVEKYKNGSIAIISPTVNSDTSKRFLNDVHSNIYDKCEVDFRIPDGTDRKGEKDAKYVISSIHESKGLEYDTVILLNTIDNRYFFDVPTYEAQCKLFVACSRARQNLIIFEHNYHFTNGSIKWITNNEHLFDRVDDKIWNTPTRQRSGDVSNRMEKNCRDFIRSLTNDQRRSILGKYSSPKVIKHETGLGDHVGEPCLSGQLIELLFASKYQFDIDFDFRPYVTADEWHKIMFSKEVPPSVMDKIHRVYPHTNIKVKRNVEGGKARIAIFFIDQLKLMNSRRGIDSQNLNSMVDVREITENHIVSDFMCNEYYKYLGAAHDVRKAVISSDSCDEEYVENIWWLLRFQKLMDMSLTGFNQPDLTREDIRKVLNYLDKSRALSELHIKHYHTHYRSEINFGSNETELWVRGEVDFECDDAFLELKCINGNELEEAWLQVMVYNLISGNKYSKIYVYNAITGILYERKVRTDT